MTLRLAPEWRTTDWLNTPRPLTLEGLRGQVVLLHAFQMLCPGCVAHGIPQAQRAAEAFRGAPLRVVGMHTVFEHHEAMQLPSLRAFLHEYRVGFPVGVDAPSGTDDPIPRTMRAYAMQGTPTTILIDARGFLRRQVFGVHEDLRLGAEIQTLLIEAAMHAEQAEGEPGTSDTATASGSATDSDTAADSGSDSDSDSASDTATATATASERCDEDGCAV